MFERGDVTRVSNPSRVSSHRGSQQRNVVLLLAFFTRIRAHYNSPVK
jgi:hypothetical protein